MAYTTINKGSSYFNTVLYTGTGATNSVTGVGFKPDFTWVKDRSNARDHQLVNAVVGYPSGTLFSNVLDAEYTAFPRVDSSNADGFTVSTPTQVNGSGETYVAWNWLANNTSGSSNTAGSTTSTVAANTTSGFSVVSYTGTGSAATVGHGLGAVPKMIICKARSAAYHWEIYHVSVGNTDVLRFTTGAPFASAQMWNNTTPTSSVFSLGTEDANTSSQTYIAYCFAEIKGFSKFSSYVGNGSADGTFIYTGFKPAMIITKANAVADWFIRDNKQDPENVMNEYLSPNTTATSGNLDSFDFVSNGFKIRNSNNAWNGSGTTYYYMAFAENPFVSSTQIPTTAR
jgi:hypothetical protein